VPTAVTATMATAVTATMTSTTMPTAAPRIGVIRHGQRCNR
jgi:hypothetical protein